MAERSETQHPFTLDVERKVISNRRLALALEELPSGSGFLIKLRGFKTPHLLIALAKPATSVTHETAINDNIPIIVVPERKGSPLTMEDVATEIPAFLYEHFPDIEQLRCPIDIFDVRQKRNERPLYRIRYSRKGNPFIVAPEPKPSRNLQQAS